MTLKVVSISDTHMSHRQLTMPDGDILIHAGDFSGTTNTQELLELNRWFGQLLNKYKKIFLVPGNHDGQFEDDFEYAKSLLTNATVLVDQLTVFEGYKIYGSPWTINFWNWWYMKPKEELEAIWKKIPDKVDILITHQPPLYILDSVTGGDRNAGCPFLRKEVVTRIKPKLHVFGHLHQDGGTFMQVDGCPTTFVNAAVNNDYYKITRGPIVIEI